MKRVSFALISGVVILSVLGGFTYISSRNRTKPDKMLPSITAFTESEVLGLVLTSDNGVNVFNFLGKSPSSGDSNLMRLDIFKDGKVTKTMEWYWQIDNMGRINMKWNGDDFFTWTMGKISMDDSNLVVLNGENINHYKRSMVNLN